MLKMNAFKNIALVSLTSLLTGCGLFDTDNTPVPNPLTSFKQEVQPKLVWSTRAGDGTNKAFLKLSPALVDNTLYTADDHGRVTAVNRINGQIIWQTRVDSTLMAGPGVGNGLVIVGGEYGEVIALDANDGKIVWQRKVLGSIIANPVVSNGRVIIKSLDGHLYALDCQNGHRLWATQQSEPSLILRGSSTPVANNGRLYAGFANGHLNQYRLSDGGLSWARALATPEGAFAVERMIDINADPLLYGNQLFAATYQGNVASLAPATGHAFWTHSISSYTGMATDGQNLYISDAKGNVWSFNNNSGVVNWRQNALSARNVSGPAVLGNYVVIGDKDGYLHWLDKRDGRVAAREHVSGSVVASPLIKNNALYVQTNSGNVYAYTLG